MPTIVRRKISEMQPANALDGSELFETTQQGNTRKASIQQVADFISEQDEGGGEGVGNVEYGANSQNQSVDDNPLFSFVLPEITDDTDLVEVYARGVITNDGLSPASLFFSFSDVGNEQFYKAGDLGDGLSARFELKARVIRSTFEGTNILVMSQVSLFESTAAEDPDTVLGIKNFNTFIGEAQGQTLEFRLSLDGLSSSMTDLDVNLQIMRALRMHTPVDWS